MVRRSCALGARSSVMRITVRSVARAMARRSAVWFTRVGPGSTITTSGPCAPLVCAYEVCAEAAEVTRIAMEIRARVTPGAYRVSATRSPLRQQ